MLSDDSSEKYLITLKKVCPTIWSSRNDALLACSLHFFLHYLKLLILFLQLYSMKIMTYRNLTVPIKKSAVKKNLLLIMKTLYQLNLISNKKDEREECKSIINILESFDFLVLVTFFSSLL
nr:unnamed protein product [Callosobruchus analis]